MANLSFNYFWITTLPNKHKILLLYRAPWHKGWAGHTSSTVQSEFLLVIEYIIWLSHVHNHHWMSLLESWNWCFFLSPWMLKIFEEDIWFHRPNPRVASFIPPFLASHWLEDCAYCTPTPEESDKYSLDLSERNVSNKPIHFYQCTIISTCI